MKFLFHYYDLHHRAGIQRAIIELSNALISEGHEVVVAAVTPRQQVAYEMDARILLEQTPYHTPQRAGIASWPGKIASVFHQFRFVRQLVKHHKPDLVVDQGTSLGLLYPFHSIGGVPFALQRHFPVQAFPNGKVLYRLLAAISGKKAIIALTESIAAELRSIGFGNVAVIPNPIPAAAVRADYEDAIPRTGLLMGRAGSSQKGFDLFLEALSGCKVGDWHFCIVGPGVPSDPLLNRLLQKYHLAERVKLLPAVDDPYSLMRASSCLIMPSRYEALPMVALEALSIGRPIIGSDADGLNEIIVPYVNGITFPAGNVQKLSECLEQICAHPEWLESMARNAPQTLNRYNRSTIVEAWTRFASEFCDMKTAALR